MKKVLVVLVVIMMLAAPAFAATTTKADYSVPSSQAFEDFLNSQDYITHQHDLDKEESKFQTSAGLDLIVYENDVLEVVQTNSHNFTTDVSVFGGKVRLNLWRLFKK